MDIKIAGFRILLGLSVLLPHGAARAASPVLTTLHTFAGAPGDGATPNSDPIMKGGVLYGTSAFGGSGTNCGMSGCGTVFAVSPPASPGGPWTEQVLYSFGGGSDGAYPRSGPVFDANGVLYGTTAQGGSLGYGTVYTLTPPASPSGPWTEQILYAFGSGPQTADGEYPWMSPIISSKGVLYGITGGGGQGGSGAAYSLTPPSSPGGGWTERVISYFPDATGAGPIGLVGKGGVLYGVTDGGGAGNGTFFSLTPDKPGSVWSLQALYNFEDSGNIYSPAYTLINGPGTTFFGTTYGTSGGDTPGGTVFSLTPPAAPGGDWTYQTIYTFQSPAFGDTSGAHPAAIQVTGANGKLVGVAGEGGYGNYGTIFELIPPSTAGGAWTEETLYLFQGGSDGAYPVGLTHAGGVIYGVTSLATPYGSVFQFTP